MLGNITVQFSATLHLFISGVAQKQKSTKPTIILKIIIYHEHSTSLISHKLLTSLSVSDWLAVQKYILLGVTSEK